MPEIKHPESEDKITGRRLEVGETIKYGDVYNSTDGTWRQLGTVFHEKPLRNKDIIIVRPDRAD